VTALLDAPVPRLDPSAFPADFLWGAATSAYQVDGAVTVGGRTPSIWDTFAHATGRTVHGDTGDFACDHYGRWSQDVSLMRSLGLNAYRFSVSWPRLQPHGPGPLNPIAVEHYRRLLGALRDAGIRPMVTLYHWELPQALEDDGGWPARATPSRFAEFAAATVDALGDLATDWITLNEPWCQAFLGYGSGIHAPGRQSLPDAVAASHHQLLAHGLAVRAIREGRHSVRLGIANILTDVVPASDSPEDLAATRRYDANSNALFLDPILHGAYPRLIRDLYDGHGLAGLVHPGDEAVAAAPIDFLGINHYQRVIVRADPSDPHLGARGVPAEPATTQLGWSVIPEAFRGVLMRVARQYPAIPLYVTENGASYPDYADPNGEVHDPERVAYLEGYLAAAAEAIAAGVDLRGYFHWSLMDNFEWGEGYRSRFGLIYVDYATQRRIPKASAAWYRELIARHRLAGYGTAPADRDGHTRPIAAAATTHDEQ
jgi:beta-glucosidase